MLFFFYMTLHYEMETSWGIGGTMNVPHSGNNLPSLLYKHLLYNVVLDLFFVYFTGIFMILYLVCVFYTS